MRHGVIDVIGSILIPETHSVRLRCILYTETLAMQYWWVYYDKLS